MILSHMAPSSLNMSSYRAIWAYFRLNSMIFINLILQTPLIRTSNLLALVSSTLRKVEDLMQETLCHLGQGTGWYLASWSCLCSAVLGHGGSGGCLSTALHRHDQLAKYHLVPWLRWHNVSWHQVFRLPGG